ncbi:unnamed protein product, partial [Prunus brigantina]
PSGFAAVDRGTTSLNEVWDLGTTWLFDHNIFGRALHGPRPRPTRLWCQGREEAPSHGRVLLGTNIAPTSLDSSATAWVEAEWIPRDGLSAFF